MEQYFLNINIHEGKNTRKRQHGKQWQLVNEGFKGLRIEGIKNYFNLQ